MNAFHWFKSRISRRGKALWLYRRGMVRAKKHDHPGAIVDYSVTIDMPNAPTDVKGDGPV